MIEKFNKKWWSIISEYQGIRPGEVLDIDMSSSTTGGGIRFSPRGASLELPGRGEAIGTVSREGQFRPAFRLTRTPSHNRPSKRTLGIEPVLVYMRKDGDDGRIEKFNPRKERVEGNKETENLLRTWSDRGAHPLRAVELCSFWYGESLRRGGSFELPVEVFLERAGRMDREQAALPRQIHKFALRWNPEHNRGDSLEYRPLVKLIDEERHSEDFIGREMVYDNNGQALIVSNPSTGTLWYLFLFDLPQAYFGKLRDIPFLLDLPHYLSVKEARTCADICRSRFPNIVDVEDAASKIRIINQVPIPIVDFGVIKESIPADTFNSMEIRFRYGPDNNDPPDYDEPEKPKSAKEAKNAKKIKSTRELPPKSGSLFPIEAEEARTLAAAFKPKESGEPAETEGKTDENTKWFISAHDEIEEHFILRLITVLDKHSIETEPDPQEQKRVPSRFLVSSSISDIISKAGNELLSLGFELQLQQRKVAHPPRKLAVRVSSSGEEWLTFEAGLETDEGFIPIEDIPARGIAEAGGKAYVLPPGSDTAMVISEMQRKRIGKRDLTALEAIADAVSNPDHPALQDFFSLRRRLSSFSSLQEAEVPDSFEGSLRPYQKSGLSWLWFLHTYKLGGCLADDMGLGKTIQALALLAKAREAGEMRRALVVCPVSTLGNWLSETRRFTPRFSAHIHAGQGRAAEAEELEAADIIFTGYATLLRDAELIRNLDLDYLILDEAQAIKNPKTKRRKTVVSIPAAHRLALTGTPIENSTIELWSLFDFLMPGIFGKRAKFTRKYGSDIERTGALPAPEHVALQQGDGGISSSPGGKDTGKDTAAEKLRRIIRPLLLRRTKAAVAPELPPKEEQILYAEAGSKQAGVYESLRLRYAKEVEELLISGEAGKSAMKILEAMLRLRQAAILPSIVDSNFSEVPSAKMDLLYDRLMELKVEGNKALVFSQFTAVLDEVELRMAGTGAQLFRLDGSTPQKKRDIQIERFQNAVGSAFFLISLKAGGVGINLTAADYVFLLDPWWNPAVESQAIDRAHRIGREGTVIAYRLITRGTIEEKMLRLQEKKRRISESLIRGESGALRELSKEDIQALFQSAKL